MAAGAGTFWAMICAELAELSPAAPGRDMFTVTGADIDTDTAADREDETAGVEAEADTGADSDTEATEADADTADMEPTFTD